MAIFISSPVQKYRKSYCIDIGIGIGIEKLSKYS